MTRVEELREKLSDEIDDWVGTISGEFGGEQDECDKEMAEARADLSALIFAVRLEEIERIKRSDAYARGDKGESGVV